MNRTKKNVLVYPRRFFVEDLIDLKNRGEMLLNVALNETSRENQWLVRKFEYDGVQRTLQQRKNRTKTGNLILRSTLLKNRLHPDRVSFVADYAADGHLYLSFDSFAEINSISGFFRNKGSIVNLDLVRLVGAGMQTIKSVNSAHRFLKGDDYEVFLDSVHARERWAMSRKALGADVWKRLCLLKILIIGAGRSGETAFLELSRLGVGDITICDADVIELRNLGEMKLVTNSDIGRNKAEVIVGKIADLRRTGNAEDRFEYRFIKNANFESAESSQAALESDVIVCCVDGDSGRDYASFIASRYHKVLLDIGTGIIRNPEAGQPPKAGFDVRLILPGDGCLRCCGGLDEDQSELEMFNARERVNQRMEGHAFRAGSLSSLNTLAIGEGLMLLQDLCAGEVAASTWIQFEKSVGRTILSPIPRSKDKCDCEI